MSIKRRIFISNVLMIAIPLAVSLAVFYAGLHILTTVTGMRNDEGVRGGEIYFDARMRLIEMAREWRSSASGPQFGKIAQDVDAFNDERGGEWPLMLIYRDGELVFPRRRPVHDTPLKRAPFEESGMMVMSGMTAYVEAAGDYKILLVDSRTHVRDARLDYRRVMRWGAIAAVLCSLLAMIVTNRFLTRFVFAGIVDALGTLAGGVRQIRDGNLGHRIDYRRDDEFAPVCADFNEMASRLEESVAARSRDERSRRELIAGISHDLRTPLTSIKAYVEGLEHGVAADDATRARYLATIRSKADDLDHIISMLFKFAKLDTGEFPFRFESADVGAVTAEAVESARDDFARRGMPCDINFIDDGGGARALIDEVQFRSVLGNLFTNSEKYSDKPRCAIDVRVAARDGSITIVVSDNGPGVPDGACEHIFDLFSRLDPARSSASKGSGLGLAISRKLIAQHGGTITASRAEMGGLAVTIVLPMLEEDA